MFIKLRDCVINCVFFKCRFKCPFKNGNLETKNITRNKILHMSRFSAYEVFPFESIKVKHEKYMFLGNISIVYNLTKKISIL